MKSSVFVPQVSQAEEVDPQKHLGKTPRGAVTRGPSGSNGQASETSASKLRGRGWTDELGRVRHLERQQLGELGKVAVDAQCIITHRNHIETYIDTKKKTGWMRYITIHWI